MIIWFSGWSFAEEHPELNRKSGKFRIKITDPQTGAVYDNMLGASDDLGQTDPQAIAGGSVVVHKP